MFLSEQGIDAAMVGTQRVRAVSLGGTVLQADASMFINFESGSVAVNTSIYGDANVASGSPNNFGQYCGVFPATENSYMQVYPAGDEFALGLGDFTVEAWVYPVAAPADDLSAIIDTRDAGGGSGIMLWYDAATEKWTVYLSASSGALQTASYSTTSVALYNWTHVAAVRYNGILSLYINGVRQSFQNVSGYNLTGNSCRIGSAADDPGITRNLNGYLDELRIVKNLAVYTGPFTPPTGGLSAVATRYPTITPVFGCTDPLAANYDPAVNYDDGSCY